METNLLNQTQLADYLGVHKSAVSHALKSSGIVKGIALNDVAVYEGEKLKGFSLKSLKEIRENPQKNAQPIIINNSEAKKAEPLKIKEIFEVATPAITGIVMLEDKVKTPLLVTASAVLMGFLTYSATKESNRLRPLFTLVGASLGAFIYMRAMQAVNNGNNLGEDRAMLESNPSASKNGETGAGLLTPAPFQFDSWN
jgi:hypothetical protein